MNTHVTDRQAVARVAMEPDGDFVVVWSSYGQDGNSHGVFGQRFAASGAPRSSEFKINTYTPGPQRWPAVATGSAGDFFVVWGGIPDGSGTSIQGRRYDAAGNPIGGEFQVNTYTTDYQSGPSVASDAVGNFVVVWASGGQDGDGSGIFAQRFGDLIFEDGFDPGALNP